MRRLSQQEDMSFRQVNNGWKEEKIENKIPHTSKECYEVTTEKGKGFQKNGAIGNVCEDCFLEYPQISFRLRLFETYG